MTAIMARIQVRRTTIQTAYVEVPINVEEFTEWSGVGGPAEVPYAMLAEYAESSGAWPHDVEALVNSATSWTTVDTEWELPR